MSLIFETASAKADFSALEAETKSEDEFDTNMDEDKIFETKNEHGVGEPGKQPGAHAN